MCDRTPVEIDLLVSQNLLRLRQSRGHSQQFIAEQLGVSFQQIQKYERGINRISAGRLYHLADILSVPIERFFYIGR